MSGNINNMQSRDFVFWLQGFFELQDPKELTEDQVNMVKRHLALVFKYEIDPSYTDDEKLQEELQNIHDGAQDTNQDDNIIYRC